MCTSQLKSPIICTGTGHLISRSSCVYWTGCFKRCSLDTFGYIKMHLSPNITGNCCMVHFTEACPILYFFFLFNQSHLQSGSLAPCDFFWVFFRFLCLQAKKPWWKYFCFNRVIFSVKKNIFSRKSRKVVFYVFLFKKFPFKNDFLCVKMTVEQTDELILLLDNLISRLTSL